MGAGADTPKVSPNLKPAWQPGQSGNPAGRPKGARSKLGEAFLEAMHADFATHGPATIVEVRETKPDQYLKVVASILPKEVELSDDAAQAIGAADSMAELVRKLAAVTGADEDAALRMLAAQGVETQATLQ